MHRANSKRLKQLIAAQGENGLAKTSLGAGVSVSTLEKMMAGTYPGKPREFLRNRLSKFLKVSSDELFPLVGASEGEAS